jgi:hypothetical protein
VADRGTAILVSEVEDRAQHTRPEGWRERQVYESWTGDIRALNVWILMKSSSERFSERTRHHAGGLG